MEAHTRLITLNHLFFHCIDNFQRDRLLCYRDERGLHVHSTERFSNAAFALRRFLCEAGLEEGDRVAILSPNRPEWHIADFAVLLARMVVVPIYAGLAPQQVSYLLKHSGCRAIIASGANEWDTLRTLLPEIPEIGCAIAMDRTEVGAEVTASLPAIVEASRPPTPADWQPVRQTALSVSPDAVAAIVYTSGTTGVPKGAMLTHGNIVFDVEQCLVRMNVPGTRQALSILPLAHVFEKLLCYGYFRLGIPIAYGDPRDLRGLLREYAPSVMGCVPRVLQKMHEAIESQVRMQPAWKQKVFHACLAAGLARLQHETCGQRVSWRDRLLYPIAKRILFDRIRRQFGGLEYIVCGGAWLNPEIERFFRALTFALVQGYGLTETSPVITLTPVCGGQIGTVGPPLDGVEVRIGEDEEILTRGPHVMKGYYRDPAGTAEAMRDGWLRTGDLGRIDDAGYLTITGRAKDLMVLSTGKNASPFVVEQALQCSRFIQSVFAFGGSRQFLTALIVPHRANIESFARNENIVSSSFEELLKTPRILALYRQELTLHQSSLSAFERVKRFHFLSEEMLGDPELTTPTQKIRRKVMEARLEPWIDSLYAREEPPVVFIGAAARTAAASPASKTELGIGEK